MKMIFALTLLASFAVHAASNPVSTGQTTFSHAKSVFADGFNNGKMGGNDFSLQVMHGQGGKSVVVRIFTNTNAGLYIASCNLNAADPKVREDRPASDLKSSENLFGNSDYGDGQGSPTGCRFGRTGNNVVVINFDLNQTATCSF